MTPAMAPGSKMAAFVQWLIARRNGVAVEGTYTRNINQLLSRLGNLHFFSNHKTGNKVLNRNLLEPLADLWNGMVGQEFLIAATVSVQVRPHLVATCSCNDEMDKNLAVIAHEA